MKSTALGDTEGAHKATSEQIPTINQHEVHDIKDLARELGMEKDFQYDATMVPRVDCSSSPLAVRLSPESTIALEAKDPAKFTDWKNFLESHWSSEINRTFVKEKVYICGAAKTGIFVNHNGMTSGCNYTQGDVYDWRKGSLQKAWDYLDEVVVNRKRTLVTKCVECRLRPGCSSCPAKSELENGHLELPVEHICHSTHLRAYVAGIEMLPHGDCDFCPGGSHYQQLQDEAFRIKSNFVMPQRKFLPVLAAALTAQSSGCHGCGS